MSSSSSGAGLRMEPQSTSLFSVLFLLLLPPPSLLYSLNNCTIDFNDESKVVCDAHQLTTVPSDVPKSATYLTLHFNDIKRIRQTDLIGFTRLETLNLGLNCISHIENGAFLDLSALTWLSLSDNKLTNLTDDMFKGLSSLMTLSLGHNQIKSISKFAFEPLNNLQELSLVSNKLAHTSDITNIVSLCLSLKILDLGFNEFTVFESDLFPFPLLNLTKLDLTSNPLRKFRVHSDVFPHLESLRLVFMNGSITEWDVSDKAFLRRLTSLNLCTTGYTIKTYRLIFQSAGSVENLNLIATLITEGLLDLACGTLSLQRLDLSVNNIQFLNDTLLQPCTNLTELSLSMNFMRDLSESSLRMLTRLTWLNMETNELSRIPLAIRNMSTLTFLSFETNHIREIQCLDFTNLTSLTELNLKSNRIYKLKSCIFKELQSLKVLNVQNNLLHTLNDFGISLPNLVTLNISQNNIGLLQKGTFYNMSSLKDLNLKSKTVTSVEDGAFEGLLNLKRLTFSQNDENIYFFAGLERLESLVMFISSHKKRTNLTVFEPLTFNSFHSLQDIKIEVDKDACVIGPPLPIIKGMDNVQVFSLDTTFCYTYSGMFSDVPHLRNLQFTNCANLSPDPELFQPIPDLQSLDLSQDHLKSLDFLFEANLTKLEKLVLVNNDLMVINETVFKALPSLKYLDLSGNPFACNCSNAGFIQWTIRNKQVYVVSAFQYRCSSPLSREGHFLLDFNVQSCWERNAFLCFISSSALVLLTLLSSFIYHFLRWQLVYGFYLLLAFLYDSKKRRQGCPHIYDAFVSYNVHDEDWVYGELVPELEGRQGWRLCLHHRDFEPGKPIMENITDAIYSSRKTLCVISRRYLQSEWCSREIQMASFRLFDEQKDVLILLFLEQMSSNQLSPFYRMRKLVKSRTYLSWTQAHSHKGLFWEKVRRALESGNEPGDNHNPLTANV